MTKKWYQTEVDVSSVSNPEQNITQLHTYNSYIPYTVAQKQWDPHLCLVSSFETNQFAQFLANFKDISSCTHLLQAYFHQVYTRQLSTAASPPQCCHLLILSLILAQLGKNMTSYNKPYNKRTMPHCRQKRTKPWPQLPCKKISWSVKFGHVVFLEMQAG